MTIEVVAPAHAEIDTVIVREVPLPTPGSRQVLLSVRAVGVNQTDWKSMHRTWPRQAPMLLGFEAAGVVAALGPPGDKGFAVAVGDAVIAYPVLGSYASELVVPVGDVLAMPATLDFPEAANLLLVGTTAAEMLAATDIRPGETVLVHGASSATGISLLQQLAPLSVRIVATSGQGNFDLIRRFGGQPVTYGSGLLQRVRDVAPNGIDAALDCVGTDEAIDVSLEVVAHRHRIVTIANAERAAQLGLRHLNGIEPASLAYRNDQRQRLIDMAAEGRLTVPVSRTLPLTEARHALDILQAGHPAASSPSSPDHHVVARTPSNRPVHSKLPRTSTDKRSNWPPRPSASGNPSHPTRAWRDGRWGQVSDYGLRWTTPSPVGVGTTREVTLPLGRSPSGNASSAGP